MSKPRLSFVVSVFNKDKIIERCIKAFLAQSLKEYEAIFVLDGPQEFAKDAILAAPSEGRFKVIEQDHVGACRARNEGFKQAQGDYICFWDADSLIEPDAAAAWVRMFDAKPEIGFIYSGYRFLNEQGAIESEPFDPWLLRVRNYISTMNPFRRELFPGWNEDLKSLQDWDFWLKIVEKGAVGLYLEGYSFATELPDDNSISGKNCTPEVWLDRVRAVQKLHGIDERTVCVSAINRREEGLRLAKLINADYQDLPTFKPHPYKTIIQIGWSCHPKRVELHAKTFSEPDVKKILFWTKDDIAEIYNEISLSGIQKYATLLNGCVRQFVEDATACDLMTKAGFKVEVMSVPLANDKETVPLPEKPKFAVDICGDYGYVFQSLEKSLPEVEFDNIQKSSSINQYTGLMHFYLDRSMSDSMKRMLLTGRHVISNVKNLYCGHVDDMVKPDYFIPVIVKKVRGIIKENKANDKARQYWEKELGAGRLLEIICTGDNK